MLGRYDIVLFVCDTPFHLFFAPHGDCKDSILLDPFFSYVFIALDIAHDRAQHILFVVVGMGVRVVFLGRSNKGRSGLVWSALASG